MLNGEAGKVSEPPSDQARDGDQPLWRAVAAGTGLGGLDAGIEGFDPAVGRLGIEGCENALPVRPKGDGDKLHRRQPTAARPAMALGKQRLSLFGTCCSGEDPADTLLDPVGGMGPEISAREISELKDLLTGLDMFVPQPQVAAVLDVGRHRIADS